MASKPPHFRAVSAPVTIKPGGATAPSKSSFPPIICSQQDLSCLQAYNNKFLGDEHYDAQVSMLGESFYQSLITPLISNDVIIKSTPIHTASCSGDPTWKNAVPMGHKLCSSGFGKQDLNHSFAQEASFEACLFHVLHSGFLTITDLVTVCATHPLFLHLSSAIAHCHYYDFHWL